MEARMHGSVVVCGGESFHAIKGFLREVIKLVAFDKR